MFDAAIEHVRKENPKKAFLLYLVDLPENDFTVTFKTVCSHYAGDPLVFPVGIGRSFYEQVLPEHSVDLGFCFSSSHWLSRHAGPLPGFAYPGHFVEDVECRQAWVAQAQQDGATMLNKRMLELRKGGAHLVTFFVETEGADEGESCKRMGTFIRESLEEAGMGELEGWVNATSFIRRPKDIEDILKSEGLEGNALEAEVLEIARIKTSKETAGEEGVHKFAEIVANASHSAFFGSMAGRLQAVA